GTASRTAAPPSPISAGRGDTRPGRQPAASARPRRATPNTAPAGADRGPADPATPRRRVTAAARPAQSRSGGAATPRTPALAIAGGTVARGRCDAMRGRIPGRAAPPMGILGAMEAQLQVVDPARSRDRSPVIAVRGLVKTYGRVEAVRGIDLDVMPGESFGFLGPNGAGKTTTIQILCTLLRATAGSASVAGFDVETHPDDVRACIGLVFQDPSLDQELTARENLDFHAIVYNVPRALRARRIDAVLEMVGLQDRANAAVKTFSGGMKRRLEIARGIMHAPQVLFLDEPTQGLDPQTRAHIWQYLRELRRSEDITIFMTTHYMDEAEYCERIAIIDHGSIVAEGTPDLLKGMVGGDVVTAGTADD